MTEGASMKKVKDEIKAFLGTGTEFDGKLSFSGAVRLDGRFKGEIFSEGTLILGETALVESDIRASHIIISGEVHGNIIAERKLELRAPGKVIGNVQAPTLTIEEGVIFEGNCRMERQGKDADKKVAVLRNEKGLDNKN